MKSDDVHVGDIVIVRRTLPKAQFSHTPELKVLQRYRITCRELRDGKHTGFFLMEQVMWGTTQARPELRRVHCRSIIRMAEKIKIGPPLDHEAIKYQGAMGRHDTPLDTLKHCPHGMSRRGMFKNCKWCKAQKDLGVWGHANAS